MIQRIILHPSYFCNLTQIALLVQFGEKVVWEVCDNFQKQTYRNRTSIVTDKGKLLLSVPIKHQYKNRQLTKNVVSDPSELWNELHWKSIITAYRSSPFFEFYEVELQPLFTQRQVLLIKHNLKTLQFLCDALGVSLSTHTTLDYKKTYAETETLDLRPLISAKEVEQVVHLPYPQVFDLTQPFIAGASALDLLFNLGPKEAKAYLERLDLSALS